MLHVYGPGGPYPAVVACAEAFRAISGVAVSVVKGEPDALASQVAADGDVFYAGSETMMADFIREHPGVVDPGSSVVIASRRIGILVRRGNPKRIESVDALHREDVALLEVSLETMADVRGDKPGVGPQPAQRVTTGQQGLEAWKREGSLDAWVTYKTWHRQAADTTDFVPIPEPKGRRNALAAVATASRHPELARQFMDFLSSDTGQRIFRENGWDECSGCLKRGGAL